MPDLHHAIEPEEMMAYLDGELSAARATEAMTHLEHCAECQTLAEDLRGVSREMAAWQVEAPGPMAAPIDVTQRPKWRLLRRPAYLLAIPAAVTALGLVAVFMSPRPQHESAALASLPLARGSAPLDAARDSFASFSPVASGRRQPAPPPPPIQSAPAEPSATAPMIERSATLTLDTHEFDQLRPRIDAFLARHHGYLADLTLNAPGSTGRSLSASLRVPSAELDAALADLRQLGRVESESEKGEDVTRQYADLVARLENARNTEQRLTQLLAQRTGKLSDVLEVEREIDRVRGQIEQMEAERRTTANLVAYATVQLNAREAYQAQLRISPDSTLTRLRNAAVDGYKNVAGGLLGAALVLIAYGPVALLWGALAFFAGRWLLRRRKPRA